MTSTESRDIEWLRLLDNSGWERPDNCQIESLKDRPSPFAMQGVRFHP